VTEITPPANYLLDANPVKDALLKWYEPTELVYENLLKPTLIFIKTDGMSGRGISGVTYRIQHETAGGGLVTLGSYVTKCGLIVIPQVTPGWYVLTETAPASGYSLPTNPVTRLFLSPGENSYTYAQTQNDLYIDQRTNPNSGSRSACGDWCGYLCSVLCAGNCGNPGGGTMATENPNSGFGNIVITNSNGVPLGSSTTPTGDTNPQSPTDSTDPQATHNQPIGSAIPGFENMRITNGNGTPLGSTAPTDDTNPQTPNTPPTDNTDPASPVPVPTPELPPGFDNIVITGGTIVYLNPDFSGLSISFGKP
jgi:hypothetical protein